MTKQELVNEAASLLRKRDARKPMRSDKHKFVITDESGNQAEFNIQTRDTEILYTRNDVMAIFDACLEVIVNAIGRGETVSLRGFGIWKLHRRAARRAKEPGTETWYDIEERYVPKFQFGNDLRRAARAYGYVLLDAEHAPNIPEPIYDEDDI